MPPIPHPSVSGRYRGTDGDFEVELRVDVDGARPTHRVSADYFRLLPGDIEYFGSMRVDAPAVMSSRSLVTINGVGHSSWKTDATHVKVAVALEAANRPAIATLTHLTSSGRVRAHYECNYESANFRKVWIEEDAEQGVERFESYDTGMLPAGCSPRTLTHLSAFADAGIEMVRPREPGTLETADVGPDASWSDAELHAAMIQHFSAFADVPQWAIWLLHARLHDRDRGAAQANLVGLMFDQHDSQRQGCALFYQGMAGTSPQRLRRQLFTCVHELGHGFNLLHSFQKGLARPLVPSRRGSLTWMAYPDLFPGGAAAFWSSFAFQFDDVELVHLRHASRDDVIMGGNPLTAGAAFEGDVATEAAQQADAGLRLRLAVPPVLPYGVPITLDLELSGTTTEGRRAQSVIGPRPGNVDIAIRGPDRTAFVFEPILRHCRVDDTIVLRAGDQPVRDSAFIHYGKRGFCFDWPGRYEIRARCTAPDGSSVLSNIAVTTVRPPVTPADRAVAELVFGDQQGTLMSLVGSDARELQKGNDALQTIVERYPEHPAASVPRLVRATNAAREFKEVGADNSIHVRGPRSADAAEILREQPGLEALLRSAVMTTDATALPGLVATLLSREPTDARSAYVMHPYIRSRIHEIATVVPQVLADDETAGQHPIQRRNRERTR